MTSKVNITWVKGTVRFLEMLRMSSRNHSRDRRSFGLLKILCALLIDRTEDCFIKGKLSCQNFQVPECVLINSY